MSEKVVFEGLWGVFSDDGGLCTDRGVPALYARQPEAWIRARESGLMNVRERRVRVAVEPIGEGEGK